MMGAQQEFSDLTASIQSQGLALSEWADALPGPWAQVLRFVPISAAFLLGLTLVLLWKRKPAVAPPREGEKESIPPTATPKSQLEEKLPLLQNELKITLEKNQRQKAQIESAKRALEVKDQQMEELQSQLSTVKLAGLRDDRPSPSKALSAMASSPDIEPREDLQEFATASEQLAQAAVDFRNNLRTERSPKTGDGAGTDSEPTGIEGRGPVDWQELLLFRSCDPCIWNRSVNETENHYALSLEKVPQDVTFLRLRRLDSGQGIVIPLQYRDLTEDGGENSVGFNGSNEEFYGARHLGIYSEALAQEVEIRFALGGWGFGHSAGSADSKTAQACAWAGQKINRETVLEITVFPRVPELSDDDQLIQLIN